MSRSPTETSREVREAAEAMTAPAPTAELEKLAVAHCQKWGGSGTNATMVAAFAAEMLAARPQCEVRSEEVALREWRDAVLGCCKACDGFDALQWGGDKSGWGFVMFFISHLNTRAMHASAQEASDSGAEIKRLRAQVEYWRLAAERREARMERSGVDVAEASTLDAPSVPSASREAPHGS